MVVDNKDNEQLKAKIAALAKEHETFFKCAVTPGFDAEYTQGDIPYLPSKLAGSALIPTAAREFRNYYLWKWLHDTGRITKPEEMKTKFGIDISIIEDLAYDPSQIGPIIGESASVPWTLWKRNSTSPTSHNATYQTSDANIAVVELSTATGPDIDIVLELSTPFTLSIRGRSDTLQPQIAYASLVDSTNGTNTPLFLDANTQKIQIIGPVACIYPSSSSISFVNTTHVIPRNVTMDPVPLKTHLADLETKFKAGPSVPAPADTDLLFQKATISLSYIAAYGQSVGTAINAAIDLTIFDLISGQPLPGVTHTGDTDLVTFGATIEPGKGSWGQGWGGGGCFALGLIRNGNHTTNSSAPGSKPATATSGGLSSEQTMAISSDLGSMLTMSLSVDPMTVTSPSLVVTLSNGPTSVAVATATITPISATPSMSSIALTVPTVPIGDIILSGIGGTIPASTPSTQYTSTLPSLLTTSSSDLFITDSQNLTTSTENPTLTTSPIVFSSSATRKSVFHVGAIISTIFAAIFGWMCCGFI
jgi:hypothetical protein